MGVNIPYETPTPKLHRTVHTLDQSTAPQDQMITPPNLGYYMKSQNIHIPTKRIISIDFLLFHIFKWIIWSKRTAMLQWNINHVKVNSIVFGKIYEKYIQRFTRLNIPLKYLRSNKEYSFDFPKASSFLRTRLTCQINCPFLQPIWYQCSLNMWVMLTL